MVKRLRKVEAVADETRKQEGPAGRDGVDGKDGRDGTDGKDGRDGVDGKDGRDGTDGKDGRDGIDGKDGRDGIDGKDGRDGIDGKDGQAPDHQWDGTKLRFKNPNGKWGKFTNLKGDKGSDGGTVVVRTGGGSGGSLGNLLPGTGNVEPAGVAVLQGGQWVNLPWSAFITVISGAIDMGVDYARREDFVGETTLYRGEAAPGALDSAAVWKIKRVEFLPDGDVLTKFAGGAADFVNVWNDRTTLEYV